MNSYELKCIINGRSTVITVQASSSAAARDVVKAQYGSSVRILNTQRVY